MHIHIFGKEGCLYCEEALRLAQNLSFDYTYECVKEQEDRNKLYEKYKVKTMPIIFEDNELIGGHKEFAAKYTRIVYNEEF